MPERRSRLPVLDVRSLPVSPSPPSSRSASSRLRRLHPWNREYLYRQPGNNGEFDIYTLGRDGVEGGDGVDADIGNWDDK